MLRVVLVAAVLLLLAVETSNTSRLLSLSFHIPIHYDPGHIKKNFQKSLIAIYGQGVRYKGLAQWLSAEVSQFCTVE